VNQIPLIVEADWLAEHLSDSGVKVLEIAKTPESYLKAHIRGAQLIPYHHYLKAFDEQGERTPHLIGVREFTELIGSLGLKRNIHYVVYDEEHGLWAARFWAICRHYGVDNISILNGSWHGWLAAGFPINAREEPLTAGTDLVIQTRPEVLISCDQLQRDLKKTDLQIWDTRRPEEFDGSGETDNQRHGHVPGALHLVWTDLLTDEEYPGAARYLKSEVEMHKILGELGLQSEKPVVTYCQAGIRAAFCQMVLVRLGFSNPQMYDASMSEWSNRTDTPLII